MRIIRTIIFLFLATAYPCVAEESSSMNKQIDQRSFTLGGLSTFAEMVGVGVKTLALSAAVTPEEMDVLVDDAEQNYTGRRCPALPRDGFDCHRPVPG